MPVQPPWGLVAASVNSTTIFLVWEPAETGTSIVIQGLGSLLYQSQGYASGSGGGGGLTMGSVVIVQGLTTSYSITQGYGAPSGPVVLLVYPNPFGSIGDFKSS